MNAMSVSVLMAVALLIGILSPVQAAETIRIAYSPQIDTAAVRLTGRMLKGVQGELVPIKTFIEAQVGVQKGDVHFGTFGYGNIATMADAGVKTVKVIAGYSWGAHSVSVRKGVHINGWKDLEGKTIGSITGSYAHFKLLLSLRHHGVDMNKVKIVHYAPGPPLLVAVKDANVDAVMCWEPMNAQIKLNGWGDYSGLRMDDTPVGNAIGVIGVNADFERHHPHIVQEFVDTLIKATNHLRANREEWIRLAIEATGAPREVVEEAIKHTELTNLIYYDNVAALTRMTKSLGLTKTDVSGAEEFMIEWKYLEKATGKSRRELRP